MKSASRTANVRISPHGHELLRKLAEEEHESMQTVLDRALERYRREKFLLDANAGYAAMKRDQAAWAGEIQEREIWDQTLADGLDEK